MSRQNFYFARRQRVHRKMAETRIVSLVQGARKEHPRMGTRKLHGLISPTLARTDQAIGRDRLFSLLRKEGLLVKVRRKSVKTTNSRHCLPVFTNRFKDMHLSSPNQAWVSDLTYIRTQEGFMYASLITDAFSRKIVGYHVGDTLESEGCLRALKMATNSLNKGETPLHHSDRGCQYCCHRYVRELQRHGLTASMTEHNHCYENAMAERVNGILKQEYYMDNCFATKDLAKVAMKNAVYLYNTKRPHMSLSYNFPEEVHRRGHIDHQTPFGQLAASAFVPSGHSLRETGYRGQLPELNNPSAAYAQN